MKMLRGDKTMRNYRITDSYGHTAVVLGHTPEHAAERCYKMYLMRAAIIAAYERW